MSLGLFPFFVAFDLNNGWVKFTFLDGSVIQRLEFAAEKNTNKAAVFFLAEMYEQRYIDNGKDEDLKKAKENFKKAASDEGGAGIQIAKHRLGQLEHEFPGTITTTVLPMFSGGSLN